MSSPSDDGEDADFDDFLRVVARSPPRTPPVLPSPGMRWGAGDRYVIERLLGTGGMGSVFLASDTRLHRQVALKVIDGSEMGDESLQRARILREAQAAAAVEHERVARVYDVGEHGTALFVAMEYVRGMTLRGWMSGRVLTANEAATIATQLAEGLHALHTSGVVHRDLKPDNVMLAATGAKLLDFGLAKTLFCADWRAYDTSDAPSVEGLSHGLLSGTPGYMAPEQCLGQSVDARGDIFALGVVIYEMIERRRPFVGHTATEVMLATVRGGAVLTEEKWKAVPLLREVAERAMTRDPSERWASAIEILGRLTESRGSVASFEPMALSTPFALAPTVVAPGRLPRSLRVRNGLLVGSAVLTSLVLTVDSMVPAVQSRPVKATATIVHAGMASPRPAAEMTGMVFLSGGPFAMGRSLDEINAECARLGNACRRDLLEREQPSRIVTLSPYYLDVNEVTNAAFVTWLNTRPEKYVRTDDLDKLGRTCPHVRDASGTVLVMLKSSAIEGAGAGQFLVRDGFANHPVTHVTWDAAVQFCEAALKRLPTEAEWEFAARGETDRRYPWGDEDPSCEHVVFGRDDDGRCRGLLDSGAALAAPEDVTAGDADWSPKGVHGLAGNVSEWVYDAFNLPFYPPCEMCTDPRIEPSGDPLGERRIFRGGSWASTLFTRTTTRGRWERVAAADTIGFRCASDAIR